MIDFFKELFEYNHYSNQNLIHLISENEEEMLSKSIYLKSHIINAHQVWNSRLLNFEAFGVFQLHPRSEFLMLDQLNYQHSLLVLDTIELSQQVTYTNSSGMEFNNSVRDILFHVINHSTYHRAQIASDFKQHDITPLATDYIYFKRK